MSIIWWFIAYTYVLLSIYYCFIMIKKHIKYKKEKFNNAMDRMSKTYIEHEIPFSDGKTVSVSWAKCVYDIPYADATKVFMYYEKLKKNYLNKRYKTLNKHIDKLIDQHINGEDE